jgi:hypothetical protein
VTIWYNEIDIHGKNIDGIALTLFYSLHAFLHLRKYNAVFYTSEN